MPKIINGYQIVEGVFESGSASLPSVRDIASLQTGVFFPSAGTVGISLAGTEVARWTATRALVLGTGEASATTSGGTLRSPNRTGTDAAGQNLTIQSGNGTGTGGSGNIVLQTAPTAGSSSTANTMATRMSVFQNGKIIIGTGTNTGGLFGNTVTNTGDYSGYGVDLTSGLIWSGGSAGYQMSFTQSASGIARNGLLVNTASTAIDSAALTVGNTAATLGLFVVRSDGNVGLGVSAANYTDISSTLHIVQRAASSGTAKALLVQSAAHTSQTASTEVIGVDFDLDATKTWATAGPVVTQREFLIRAPTYATSTFTTAATFAVTGAPIGTITSAYSIWSQGGTVRIDNSGGTTHALSIVANPTANQYGIDISGSGPANQEMSRIVNSTTSGIAGFVLSGDTNTLSGFGQAGSTVGAPFTNNFAFYTGTSGNAGFTFGIRQTGGTYSFYAGGTAAGNLALSISNNGNFALLQQVNTSGTPTGFLFTGGAHTGQTAATEVTDVNWNLSGTKTWATGAGPLAAQRDVRFQPRTYAGGVAALVITTATNVDIGGAPSVGANMTIANSSALSVGGATTQISTGNATMAYGAIAVPPHTVTLTGSTNITTSVSAFSAASLNVVTISNASLTVTNAATLYIAGAPAAAGGAAITNAYSLWVDAGASRLDGNLSVAGTTTLATALTGILRADSGVVSVDSTLTNTTAGTYTPTRSAEVNMDSNVTTSEAQYMRVGNTVTVSGTFIADPTTTTLATSFEMTLPVASNIGAVEDCAGVAVCGNIVSMSAGIFGSVANNTAVVSWKATDVTSQSWSYTFTYQVI